MQFLDDHAGALEADFLTHFHTDIRDLSGPLTWPRFARLISRLPRDSWTVGEVGGDAARWGEQEHLLATLIDVQVRNNWLLHRAHFKGQPSAPPPFRRPGSPEPDNRIGGKKSYTREEFDALRASMTPKAEVADGN